MSLHSEAAQLRAAHVGTRADRPLQRRCAQFPDSPRVAITRGAKLQLRDTGDGTEFTGYASVVSRGYEMWDMFGPYTEEVVPGAFANTLNMADLDVPLVLAHDSLRRIARTSNGSLTLAEDDHGLLCRAPQLDPTDVDVNYISPKIRSGLIDEMSFAFRIVRGEWSPDWTQYNILEVDINRGDVAIVGYGANPYTSVALRSVTNKLTHKRALDPQDVSVLTQALGWFTAIDSIVDEAQESLAAYLGTPNPDPDEGEDVAELAQKSLLALRAREARLRADMTAANVRPALRLADI
ncbi:MAG: HK97 family phage prohead protease [Actinobacteria bacterium]|nr:HK97 family phage prohead protease [Actinomycetota bacterium]